MATVQFYEKPGCINNTKQKNLLRQAGHTVIERDLLTTPWQKDELLAFFSGMPVSDWFNSSAPRVRSGEVTPEKCSVEEAISLMLEEPLLIRRPLMKVGNERMAGFDQTLVDDWIGLTTRTQDDVESCPRGHDKVQNVSRTRAESE